MEATESFVLLVRRESLTISRNGSIFGEVWCQFGRDQSFPEVRWSDFVVVVLGWWLENIVTLVDGRKRNATISFMDGPFEVNVFAKRMDSWDAEFVARRVAGDQVLHRVVFAPDPFIDSLIQASEAILQTCAENDWISADVDSLVLQRERLIHYKAKHRGSGKRWRAQWAQAKRWEGECISLIFGGSSKALSRSNNEIEPVVVCNGDDAIEFLQESKTRLSAIILDFNLPGSHSGLAVLNAIRRVAGMGTVPVIFLTAGSSPEDEYRIRSMGVMYRVKPFGFDDMLQVVAELSRFVEKASKAKEPPTNSDSTPSK
jgi:CheY-like chemotaxis protein